MPAPKNPNTAAATAAVRRRGQETMAAKLRAAGWTVTPPEQHKSDYGVPLVPGVPLCVCNHPRGGVMFCPIHHPAQQQDKSDRGAHEHVMAADLAPGERCPGCAHTDG